MANSKQTIYKYGLGKKNNTPATCEMPKDSQVLHIDWDPNTNEVCVWVIVFPQYGVSEEWETRTFYFAGTGLDLAENLKGDEMLDHINSFSVMVPGMTGWFHAFEVHEDAEQSE